MADDGAAAWAVEHGGDIVHVAIRAHDAEEWAGDGPVDVVPLYRDANAWVPVSDRFPPVNEPVLYTCYIDDTEGYWIDVDVGCWDGNERNGTGNPIMRDRYGARSETHWSPCSHWMPLPAPPVTIA